LGATHIAKEKPVPKGYWIGQLDITDPAIYNTYKLADVEPFKDYGARYVVRGGRQESPEGHWRSRTVVIEFPSYDAAVACYHDPQFQAIMAVRKLSSIADVVIVEGHEPEG